MVKKLAGEKWKPFRFDGHKAMRYKYAISSHGRIASYRDGLSADGKVLKGSATAGYRTFNIHTAGTAKTLYLHREVALHFLPKKKASQEIVIHLNHDKADNHATNLKWVTLAESISHQQHSPARKAFKKKQLTRKKGLKLTETEVKSIKRAFNDPKNLHTNKQLAAKYGVSEMTIYRIKRGENWARI